MLKLKLQYFGYLMQRTDSFQRSWCWERLKVGGEGDERGWDGWMASPTQWACIWVNSGSWQWTRRPACCSPWGRKESDMTELNWTDELILLNCGVGEDSWESLGLQGNSNQSILKEISPGISSEGMMLKLKLQYFGHLMWRVDSLEKSLMLGGIGGRRRRGRQRMRWLDASLTRWTWVWVNSGSWWRTGRPGVLRFMGSQRVGHNWATELNWTEIITLTLLNKTFADCF